MATPATRAAAVTAHRVRLAKTAGFELSDIGDPPYANVRIVDVDGGGRLT
jgi:hypothetical protein